MRKIISLLRGWFRRLLRWLKNVFARPIAETQDEPPFVAPAKPIEESTFDIPHSQEEFNEVSSSGGPSQDARAPEQKSELKHNVPKPKTPAPPRR